MNPNPSPDQRLDQLFTNVRKYHMELPGDFGFETRLLASIRAARAPKSLLDLLVWRMLPAFASITLAAAIYSDKNQPLTDLTGRFLGENALVEYLAN